MNSGNMCLGAEGAQEQIPSLAHPDSLSFVTRTAPVQQDYSFQMVLHSLNVFFIPKGHNVISRVSRLFSPDTFNL